MVKIRLRRDGAKKAPYYKIRKKGVKTDRIGTICGLPVIFDIFSEA